MLERSTTKTVTFQHPFTLKDVDMELPAGCYEVETIEERLDTLSEVAYRRLSTTMTVHRPITMWRQMVAIDPADLEAALEKDRDHGSAEADGLNGPEHPLAAAQS